MAKNAKQADAETEADTPAPPPPVKFKPGLENLIGEVADDMLADMKAAAQREPWEKLDQETQRRLIDNAKDRAQDFEPERLHGEALLVFASAKEYGAEPLTKPTPNEPALPIEDGVDSATGEVLPDEEAEPEDEEAAVEAEAEPEAQGEEVAPTRPSKRSR